MAYFLGKELAPGADINSLLSGAYNLSRNQSTPINATTSPGTALVSGKSPSPTTPTLPSRPDRCESGYRKGSAPCPAGYREIQDANYNTNGGKWCCPIAPPGGDDNPPAAGCVAKVEGQNCPTGQVLKTGTGGKQWCCPGPSGCIEGVNCIAPKKCVDGVCKEISTDCPEGVGEKMDGCSCGKWYTTMTGKCTGDYVFIDRSKAGTNWDGYKPGAKGRCECPKYLNQDNGDNVSEYKYPPEMQELMDLLLGRATDLLGKDTGYSQEAQDAMFGKNFDRVRTAETGSRESLEEQLARAGMLGTGTGLGALSDLSQSTENNITDIARQIFVGNEEKKKQDLLDYTNLANQLTTSGVSFEQIQEAINAARRGESQSWYAMLMALYQAMLGSAS